MKYTKQIFGLVVVLCLVFLAGCKEYTAAKESEEFREITINMNNLEKNPNQFKIYVDGKPIIRKNIIAKDWYHLSVSENAKTITVETIVWKSIIKETITITKSINIESQEKYKLIASFDGQNLTLEKEELIPLQDYMEI